MNLSCSCTVLGNTVDFNRAGHFLNKNLMQILYINHILKIDPPNQRLTFTLSSLTLSLVFKQHSKNTFVLNSVGCEMPV